MKPRRFDLQKIDGYEVTPAGFLKIPVYAARTGIQLYRDGTGKEVREFRPPDEVFSQKTMDSFKNCPMTNDHPNEMVNVDNAKALMCGVTVDSVEKVEGQYVKTFLMVYDKKAIEDIRRGKHEVSMGYELDLEFTPGEFNGQKYDAIQRNIVNNHIALVDRARGGRNIRLRLDGQDAILVTERDNSQEENEMKIKIGEKEFDVAQDVADAFTAYTKEVDGKLGKLDAAQADLTKANEKVKELEGKTSTLTTEKDSLQAKVDGLEADKTKTGTQKADAATIEAAVKERRKIDKVAEKVMSEEEFKKTDSMTALELKKAVIKAECSDVNLDGKSETYVDARFDHIAEQLDTSSNANADAGKKIAANRKKDSSEKTESEKAREKAMDDATKEWQKPLGKKQA